MPDTAPAAFVAAWLNANPLPQVPVPESDFQIAVYQALMREHLTAMLEAYTSTMQREAAYWRYLREFAHHGRLADTEGRFIHWAISSPFLGDHRTGYATVDEAMDAHLRLEKQAQHE